MFSTSCQLISWQCVHTADTTDTTVRRASLAHKDKQTCSTSKSWIQDKLVQQLRHLTQHKLKGRSKGHQLHRKLDVGHCHVCAASRGLSKGKSSLHYPRAQHSKGPPHVINCAIGVNQAVDALQPKFLLQKWKITLVLQAQRPTQHTLPRLGKVRTPQLSCDHQSRRSLTDLLSPAGHSNKPRTVVIHCSCSCTSGCMFWLWA